MTAQRLERQGSTLLSSAARRAFPVLLAASALAAGCRRMPAAADAGPLPAGFVDVPKSGEAIAAGSQLLGWAYSPAGVQEVAVYVDGVYVQSARLGLSRPDVGRGYPDAPAAMYAGWAAALPGGKVAPGGHDIVVQIRTKSGSTRDLPLHVTVR